MRKYVPSYSGTLRSHGLTLPHCISECSGIRIFGKRIKSIAFSTDAAIIKNINADAIIAVYPFTPQASISQAVINVADVPVFVGVGGGYTNGSRSVRLAMQAEHQGAYGVVVNAPMPNEVIAEIKSVVDIPVIATVVSDGRTSGAASRRGRISSMFPARRRPRTSSATSASSTRTQPSSPPRADGGEHFRDHPRGCERHHHHAADHRRAVRGHHARLPREEAVRVYIT